MKKKYILLLPALATSFVVAAGMGIATSADAKEGWSDVSLEAAYAYKDEFVVADRTYTVGGKTYDASVLVYYPDGSVSSDERLVLSQAGNYAVKYSVQAGDSVYTDTQRFLVQYPSYDVSLGKSSVSYGTPTRATTPGVMARIAQNDALTFTQYIDFTKVTAEDKLIEGYVIPDMAGANDFKELIFTFTDSEDESVFFQVHHYAYDWTYNTYVAANGQNQKPTGNNQTQGIHEDDGFGTWSQVSFNSQDKHGIVAPDATKFYVMMDYEKKEVYVHGYANQKWLCIDLDSADIEGDWTGFPSGKARLSVTADSYVGSTANVCVTSVYGLADLSDNVYLDTVAPTVTIEEGFEETMPDALVGNAYSIPNATAYDAYAYEREVNVSVWMNYGMSNCVKVAVAEGKFIPNVVGTYTIVYEATDVVGNVGRLIKHVSAHEEISDADFTLPTEKTTEAKTGEWVTVPSVDEAEVTGGSGKKTMQTFVEKDGARKEIQGGFRAEETGEYRVVYVATDYVGKQTEKFYTVTVTAGNVPVLARNYDVYPAYISEQSYRLPAYSAYVYENGKLNEELCDVVVKDANGSKTYKAGSEATIVVNENGDKVEFEIQCRGTVLAKHESVGVKALVQEGTKKLFHVENYLVGEGFAQPAEKLQSGGLAIRATSKDGLAYTFANAVSVRYASIKMQNFTGWTENASVRVTIADVLDASRFVQVTLRRVENRLSVEIGGVTHTLTSLFGDESVLEIVYQDNAFTVNGESFAVANFDGFESDKAFVNVAYEGYGEDASFVFSEFGNCRFNTASTDRIKPILFSESETGGTFRVGDTYVVRAPISYDVYSPNTVYTLTVTDEKGNVVRDVNGLALEKVDPTKDYEILLSEIGDYVVYYEAEEAASFVVTKPNAATLRYSLSVADEEAPTISWKGKFETSLKAGGVFVLPNYKATDNYSSAENIVVRAFVETPEGQMIMLPGNSIQMTHVGVYEVRIMVVDEAGNVYSETHFVNVTKEAK